MRIFSTRRGVAAGIYAGFFAAIICFFPISSNADKPDGLDDTQRVVFIIEKLQQQQIAIPNIIFAAEIAGKGTAIGFEFTDNYIEVALIRDNDIIRVYCSLLTGDVINIGTPEIIHSFLARISNRYHSVKTAKISLREAIAIAEESEQGITYETHVEYLDGWANYEIEMIVNNKPLQIIIDPENGRIVGRHRGRFDDH